MLHRSFKGGKCKTSLKLAVARIKLLRNKRNSQLIQMKRDLAQLLESGQEKTARIRVEHVVREEKTMAAYDLIDIYCELIVARLPIIESQKTCPIDLKEAITSVIFAAPRCADVPELLDVRKHFTAKYGKEFITAALELRPDCGVNRTMVEKLSARAPDGETKMKILAAIAQEHNINWDPNVIAEEEKPPEDLLKGPATFVTSSTPAEAPTSHVSPTPGQKYESSVDTSEKKSPLNSQDYASANAAFTMAKPNTTPLDSRDSESRREETEFKDSSSNDRNTMSFNRPHWNMEFKDATSAAQAAVECAERASMAARAAAELSSLGKYRRQSSPELHESSGYGLRDEGPGISTGPSLRGHHESVRMMNSSQAGSSQNVDPKIQTQQRGRSDIHNQRGSAESMYDTQRHSSQNVDPRIKTHQRGRNDVHNQQGSAGSMHDSHSYSSENVDPRIQAQRGRNDIHNQQGSTGSMHDAYGSINRRSRQPVSPDFTTASIDDDMVDNDQREDIYYQRRSSEEESDNTNRQGRNSGKDNLLREVSRKKQPSQLHVEYIDQPQENKKTEYTGSSAEENIRKQSSRSSSSLHRLSSDDDDDDDDNILDPNIQNDRNYGREHSFSNTGLGNVQKGTKQLSANDYHDVHFDGYGSEEDHVEAVYDIHDSDSYVPSPVRESPPHSSPTRSTRTSRLDRNESLEHDARVQSNFIVESHSPSRFHETLAKSTMPSKSFDLLPATFDDSDGLSEEEIDNYKSSGRTFDDSNGPSEEKIDNYRSSGRTETSSLPLEHDIFTRFPEPAQVESGYGSQKSSIPEKETTKDSQKPLLYSSYDDLESEDRHTGTTPTIRRNVGGESVKRYSGHGSTKSSFTKNEGTRTDRKSRLPSSSDDSESEVAYSLKNQSQLDGGGKARKKYGHDVLPFPNRTSQAVRPNVGGESANSYSSHGSNKSFSTVKESAGTERKPRLLSSSDDLEPESAHSTKNQGIDERQTMKTSRFHSATSVQAKDEFYAPISPDAIKDSELRSFSRAESGQGLNFGRLTGGIKNKVSSRRTYKREPSNDAAPPSIQQAVEYTPTLNEKSTASPKFKSSTIPQAQDQELRNQKQQKELRQELSSRSPRTFVDSDSDDAEVPPQKDQELRNQKQQKELRQELSSRSPRTFVDSDSDDAEVPPLRTVSSKGYTGGGLSRKKKDSPADSTSRLSTSSVGSDVSVTSSIALTRKYDSSVEQKTPKSMPQPEVSVRRASPRLQKRNPPVEQKPSKPVPEPEVIAPVSIKTVPETATSGSTNNSKPSLSKEGETSRENSFKKAGHVHPKLPDYDSFAAHFESLRSNRR